MLRSNCMLRFEETKIYKVLTEEPVHKVSKKALRLIESGRDVTLKDEKGRGYLFLISDHYEKFSSPLAVPVVYQLCLGGIDVNNRDENNNTVLHELIKKRGVFRIVIALLRCGANPLALDNEGLTVKESLLQSKPEGWEENYYWLEEYSPGLVNELQKDIPELKTVERLLKSWCLTRITNESRGRLNLLGAVENRESLERKTALLQLLRKFDQTSEFVAACLAGSINWMKKCLERGRPDVNTKDFSYRFYYDSFPKIPQPLLAAVWEQNCVGVVEELLTLWPDTSTPYENSQEPRIKPLFFHVLTGPPKLLDYKIIQAVLRQSNTLIKDQDGQNILFTAMKENFPAAVLKDILSYRADLAERDFKGRTPRDFAAELSRDDYIEAIDEYVLETILKRDLESLENWVLKGYNYIYAALESNSTLANEVKSELEGRLFKETAKFIRQIRYITRCGERMFRAVDEGDLATVLKYAQGQFHMKNEAALARDVCGRHILHKALLTDNELLIISLIERFPYLVNFGDNLNRTSMHYGYLLHGRNDIVSKMVAFGGSDEVKDVRGRVPSNYFEGNITTLEHQTLTREVVEFSTWVHLHNIDFESKIREYIAEGNLDKVEEIVPLVMEYADLSFFSHLLFDCIESNQDAIAQSLINGGCKTRIWKQYGDRLISLREKAHESGMDSVVQFIDENCNLISDDDENQLSSFDELSSVGSIFIR
ncbi:DgyrCDS7752 [Dimorphilus gyrociliatus]|uniref:DgyrCDS7752 n=1 Tax=Dimorphilus gyrociliatus TaxID=2664684 RepID=A0A7I8VS09_9ANNE|nr:DgyrCDS7752 [Dimorphilus gyrociliatus]